MKRKQVSGSLVIHQANGVDSEIMQQEVPGDEVPAAKKRMSAAERKKAKRNSKKGAVLAHASVMVLIAPQTTQQHIDTSPILTFDKDSSCIIKIQFPSAVTSSHIQDDNIIFFCLSFPLFFYISYT
jgi:hypothetical protein